MRLPHEDKFAMEVNYILTWVEKIFWHPPKWLQALIWSFAACFFILLIFHTMMGEPVKLTFNFQLQLIEVEVGNKITQVPANIEIIDGHMLVNGIPIRGWLENQGFIVVWDESAQAAVATSEK